MEEFDPYKVKSTNAISKILAISTEHEEKEKNIAINKN